jgi:hypothetical protein
MRAALQQKRHELVLAARSRRIQQVLSEGRSRHMQLEEQQIESLDDQQLLAMASEDSARKVLCRSKRFVERMAGLMVRAGDCPLQELTACLYHCSFDSEALKGAFRQQLAEYLRQVNEAVFQMVGLEQVQEAAALAQLAAYLLESLAVPEAGPSFALEAVRAVTEFACIFLSFDLDDQLDSLQDQGAVASLAFALNQLFCHGKLGQARTQLLLQDERIVVLLMRQLFCAEGPALSSVLKLLVNLVCAEDRVGHALLQSNVSLAIKTLSRNRDPDIRLTTQALIYNLACLPPHRLLQSGVVEDVLGYRETDRGVQMAIL